MAPPIDRATTAEDQKMVHDAQRLFSEARYDVALMVATAILESDPYCVNALAIKGDCHERLGEYVSALECYRDILKVEPDSQLDRIRVARLEKIVSSGEIEIGQPNTRRRTALGAAVAAAILLVSSGSALILAAQNSTTQKAAQTVDVDSASSQPFYPVPLVPGNSGYSPNNQAAPQDPDLGSLESVANGGISPLTRPGDTQRIADGVLRDVPRGQYDPVAPNRIDPGTVEPLRPNMGSGLPRTSPPGDPDPKVLAGTTGGDGGRNSIVEVRPSKNGDPPTGNTQVEDRAIRIDSLIRVAREQMVIGNFAKAADAYEKALELGASPASTNQRLAQCYEKLNRRADAIRAYERAITAFEKLDQNDVRVQTQLEACRAELKNLRGN